MERPRFSFFLLLLVGATMSTFYLIAVHSKMKPLMIDGGTKDQAYVYHQNHNRREFLSTEFLSKSWTANQTKVFYNKVPKCGSRTMTELIGRIHKKRNFMVRSWPWKYVTVHHLSHQQQGAVVRLIDDIQAPLFYNGELHFIDFKRFGSAQPVYINLIRDPLDRLVSEYYYRRFKDDREAHKSWQFEGPEDLKNQTFDSCVLNNMFECVNDSFTFNIIPYFCGHDDICRLPSEQALNQAKFNVINNYLVVGILPEFDVFLLIVEKLLPKLFAGISELYKNPGQQLKDRIITTKTKYKQDPSPEAAKIMKERLKMEYEFYDFVKERFHKLKHDLGFGE